MTIQDRIALEKRASEGIDLTAIVEGIVNTIRSDMSPEDIFSESDLTAWANENGLIRKVDFK